jgi:hypothetical protein
MAFLRAARSIWQSSTSPMVRAACRKGRAGVAPPVGPATKAASTISGELHHFAALAGQKRGVIKKRCHEAGYRFGPIVQTIV